MDNFHLLGSFKGKRILVIGDLMLDEYFRGKIHRQSPEAQVPVVLAYSHDYHLGGAANVCANVVSLGGSAHLLGVVGQDEAGTILQNLAKEKNVFWENGANSIISDGARKTTRKIRVFSNGSQIARLDEETPSPIPKGIENSLLLEFKKRLPKTDCAIISDYNKGVVTKYLANECIRLCSNAKIPILIDSKNYLSFNLLGATLLKPNLKELSKETSLPTRTQDEIERAGFVLLKKLRPKALLVTAGESGMYLFENGKADKIPGIKAKVADVSGAGDTVISTMALCLACKSTMRQASHIANFAASLAVAKSGTSSPSVKEIAMFISSKEGLDKPFKEKK
ncbi:bifunctional hydroxymethylpyrimidine kinase/phosphomethylpyrimidine kinase [Candidatus Micrarchaeota archaeon]|nr:bifunctional hydroxymethylpyrimidine kinase/phosphomethylpyrimidine kinase [Candidatus Micrarchaeota archaeon]